jgi:thioredoxin 1
MSSVLAITDSTWEAEIEKPQGFAMVDFWAEWCGPCRMIAPTVDELANEYSGKLKVGKVDVDGNSDIAGRFGIRSIPCLILFKDGKEKARVVGAQNKAQLKAWLDKNMA